MDLAGGALLSGQVLSPTVNDLDSLPFPRWNLIKSRRFGYTNRGRLGLTRAVPMLTSRSCPSIALTVRIESRQLFARGLTITCWMS